MAIARVMVDPRLHHKIFQSRCSSAALTKAPDGSDQGQVLFLRLVLRFKRKQRCCCTGYLLFDFKTQMDVG